MQEFKVGTTKGIPAKIAHSGVDENGSEVLYHTDESGFVFNYDTGNSFDSSNIVATYKSPDLDYVMQVLEKLYTILKQVFVLKEQIII